MSSITGFIYYLQNPITGEIFYVGATECSLLMRLRTHYQHLREYERGLRKSNKRYEYLHKLRPIKATIHLLEIVIDRDRLEKQEIFHIRHFRKINPNLTNMTDGGKGKCTNKYYTENQMEDYISKISVANKNKKKPEGFAEHLSNIRLGIKNPSAKLLSPPIVCSKDGKYIDTFYYCFEINNFIGNRYAAQNVKAYIKRGGKFCYGFIWEYQTK